MIDDDLDFFIVKIPKEIDWQTLKWRKPEKTYVIAEQLISLTDIPLSHFPTQRQEIPIRLDLLLDNILSGQNFILPGYVRNLCEWFGFHLNSNYIKIWREFAKNYQDQFNLSPSLEKLIDHDFICSDRGNAFLPSPIFFSLSFDKEAIGWNNIDNLLNKIRSVLLGNLYDQHLSEYDRIISVLRSPNPTAVDLVQTKALAKGRLVDLMNTEFSTQPKIWVDAVINTLHNLYESNPEKYRSTINRYHGPVWNHLGDAHRELDKIHRNILAETPIDKTNYLEATKKVKLTLLSVARAYATLTNLEKTLGIDRYLGGPTLREDNEILHSKVRVIKDIAHKHLIVARDIFLTNWNLSNIHSIILRLLNLSKSDSISQYFPNDQQRVIFLLIDALGFTQLRWFMETAGQTTLQTSLSNNIFQWLSENTSLKDEFVLASNLISITGSCLPTIFTGGLPKDTGIVGSYVVMDGHHLNVLLGKGINSDQKLPRKEVEKIFRRNTAQELVPFPETAMNSNVDVQVFHGGVMRFKPFAEYTYGNLLKNNKVLSVDPADRIFSEAKSFLHGWNNSVDKKKLAVFYYPLIDSHGHGSGPYTQFQTAALTKLNFVLSHFLIDLAVKNNEIFDGKTSLVITADHGMYESSDNVVNDKLIKEILGGTDKCKDIKFVYDNRAMHLYGMPEEEIETNRGRLLDYFASQKIEISVITKNDDIFKRLISDYNKFPQNIPDMILHFYGKGIFYHNQDLPAHRFLYGAHGGISAEEVFVPFMRYTFTPDLANRLRHFTY